ncbi:MAG: 16S rRNA (guanine(527)-N(7))-methyltransferase RsmG [Geminicoccaceae bacterium]
MPKGQPEQPLSPEGCAELLGVSRETLRPAERWLAELTRWNARINLVSQSTLQDPWRRHVLDSGQLLRALPSAGRRLVDLGSGAGLPGLVLAGLGVPEVHLIESDKRKATFLREAARAMGVKVTVHACRIEAAPPVAADVVTARALAPVADLLRLAAPFVQQGGTCLFLKGRSLADELTEARETWKIDAVIEPSLSDPGGQVLLIRTFEPVQRVPEQA